MAIKAITFDLDNTLWPLAPTLQRAEQATYQWLKQHAEKICERFSAEDIVAERMQLFQREPTLQWQISQLRINSIKELAQRSGYDKQRAERISSQAFQFFYSLRQQVTPYPGVEKALKALSAHYELATISNGNADVASTVLGDYFSFSLNAETLGSGKPEKEIFLAAIDTFNHCREQPLVAGEIAHIGDDFSCDIVGAQRAGIKTVWLKRVGEESPTSRAVAGEKEITADVIIDEIRILPEVIAAL